MSMQRVSPQRRLDIVLEQASRDNIRKSILCTFKLPERYGAYTFDCVCLDGSRFAWRMPADEVRPWFCVLGMMFERDGRVFRQAPDGRDS